MQLSLTQPYSWALLLLLLSSILLWKDVASVPLCEEINGQCQLTLEYFFNQACGLSKNTSRLTLEIFDEFDQEYFLGPRNQSKIPRLCYNYFLPVPNITTEGQDNQPDAYLKVTIGMLVDWNNILRHVLSDIADLESITGVGIFMSKIREIAENFTKLAKLLRDVKSLLNLVRLEFEEEEDYPVSDELPSLDQLQKPSLVFYYALLGCLNYNASKVATHIMILRCQMLRRKC